MIDSQKLKAMFPNAHKAFFAQNVVCECGAKVDIASGEWRWSGSNWEHHHGYPIGHVAVKNGDPGGRVDQAAGSKPADGGSIPSRDSIVMLPSSRRMEKLNKTESAFHRLLLARQLPDIGVQDITLILADDTRYTPDFRSRGPNDEMVFYEVKGFMRDDARVKLKVAARCHPWARFYLVHKTKWGFSEKLVNS